MIENFRIVERVGEKPVIEFLAQDITGSVIYAALKMPGNDLSEMFNSIPLVTRYWHVPRTYCGLCVYVSVYVDCTCDCEFLASFYVLLEPMVLTVLYIWSQLNRDVLVQFWFGMQFKAMYFPWVLVIFNLIVRGSAIMELVGIIVGHLYYFFVFQYPQEYGGRAILKTPEFLYRLFPNQRGVVTGFGEALVQDSQLLLQGGDFQDVDKLWGVMTRNIFSSFCTHLKIFVHNNPKE
ncbi:unnamed protein product [Heterobilharzia americana]|nr:unnamed protein product [Heterobilharzia americana]